MAGALNTDLKHDANDSLNGPEHCECRVNVSSCCVHGFIYFSFRILF